MATATENQVLRVLADELETLPGIKQHLRPTVEKIVNAMREMGHSSIFESGRYDTLDDIIESTRFMKAKRDKMGVCNGNKAKPLAELDPGYKIPRKRGRPSKAERFRKPPMTKEELDLHPRRPQKLKRLTPESLKRRMDRQAGRK